MESRLQYFLENLRKEINDVFPQSPLIWAIERSIDHCLDKWELDDSSDNGEG